MSSISLKTHKMLWGRSGNMCAFPDCKQILVADETSTDDPSVVGEEAHIIARKEKGPRGINNLDLDKRDYYNNLILMCSVHHKTIDDQVEFYTINKLKDYKETHEKWVKESLEFDSKKQKDDEIYATYIAKFSQLSNLENWNDWTSRLVSHGEFFPKKEYDSLKELPKYIISRIWSKRYPKLEMSLVNFVNILNDLFSVFNKYIKEHKDEYRTEKFYKNYYHLSEQDEIDDMLRLFEYHTSLVIDLTAELTRAANYICDFIREYLFEGYRIEEGALLLTSSDLMRSETHRVEYKPNERIDFPYQGLKDFMELRVERDIHYGSGVNETYFLKYPWEKE
jgi:hypothetical protein